MKGMEFFIRFRHWKIFLTYSFKFKYFHFLILKVHLTCLKSYELIPFQTHDKDKNSNVPTLTIRKNVLKLYVFVNVLLMMTFDYNFLFYCNVKQFFWLIKKMYAGENRIRIIKKKYTKSIWLKRWFLL